MVEQLFLLKGKTIVITGASRGIGKTLTSGLLALGGIVVLSDNNQIEIDSAARELDPSGKQTLAVQCDVTHRNDCERLVSKTIERFQSLDVMICNAGIGMIKSADAFSDDDWG
jgi:NAD(P)-dependent dehydrogenase (short-subunit alcohol dehydrogenase family)